MDLGNVIYRLADRLGDDCVISDADMSKYCSFRCGGKAKLLVIAEDMDALRYSLYVIAGADAMFPSCGSCGGSKCQTCEGKDSCGGCGKKAESDSACGCGSDYESGCGNGCGGAGKSCELPYMIIGNGSNILVKDNGYDGIIIKLGESFSDITIDGNRIIAGASALLSTVARAAAGESLTGLEFASGIPGSIGGGVFMNAGAYGGELKDVIKSVKAISRDGMREYMADVTELELSYRHSIFAENGDIITEVELELQRGDKSVIEATMKELAEKRNSKQPVQYPSAGSFFKRPKDNFAGALVEKAGLKGLSVGGAQVSDLHAGFIINKDNATATDIINLMHLVQNTVFDKDGIMLEPEVRIIG